MKKKKKKKKTPPLSDLHVLLAEDTIAVLKQSKWVKFHLALSLIDKDVWNQSQNTSLRLGCDIGFRRNQTLGQHNQSNCPTFTKTLTRWSSYSDWFAYSYQSADWPPFFMSGILQSITPLNISLLSHQNSTTYPGWYGSYSKIRKSTNTICCVDQEWHHLLACQPKWL